MNYINLTPAQQMRKDESEMALSVLPRMLTNAKLDHVSSVRYGLGSEYTCLSKIAGIMVKWNKPSQHDGFYEHRINAIQAQIEHHTSVLNRLSKWLCSPIDGQGDLTYQSSLSNDVHYYDWDSGYQGYAPVKTASIGAIKGKDGKVTQNNPWEHEPITECYSCNESSHHVEFEDEEQTLDSSCFYDTMDEFTQAEGVTIRGAYTEEFDRENDRKSDEWLNKVEHLETTHVQRIMLLTGGTLKSNNWL